MKEKNEKNVRKRNEENVSRSTRDQMTLREIYISKVHKERKKESKLSQRINSISTSCREISVVNECKNEKYVYRRMN